MTTASRQPSEETLRALKEDEELTDAQIAERYGVSDSTVGKWRRDYGIEALDHKGPPSDPLPSGQSITITKTCACGKRYRFCAPIMVNVKLLIAWEKHHPCPRREKDASGNSQEGVALPALHGPQHELAHA